MACRAAATGVLTQCRVVAETVRGEHFGDAARIMAQRRWLTVTPRFEDGQPVDGEEIIVFVPFQAESR